MRVRGEGGRTQPGARAHARTDAGSGAAANETHAAGAAERWRGEHRDRRGEAAPPPHACIAQAPSRAPTGAVHGGASVTVGREGRACATVHSIGVYGTGEEVGRGAERQTETNRRGVRRRRGEGEGERERGNQGKGGWVGPHRHSTRPSQVLTTCTPNPGSHPTLHTAPPPMSRTGTRTASDSGNGRSSD